MTPPADRLREALEGMRAGPVPATIATDDAFRDVYCQGYRHALTDVLNVLVRSGEQKPEAARFRELARQGALAIHREAHSREGFEDGHQHPFGACPHLDCVLVRSGEANQHEDRDTVLRLQREEIRRLELELADTKLAAMRDFSLERHHREAAEQNAVRSGDAPAPAVPPDLLAAAKRALHEMCHVVATRNEFTDAVDALDAAISKAEASR